jgi:hypothetical protein
MQAGVTQGYVLSHTLYSLFINDTHQTADIYLAFFAGRHLSICDRPQRRQCSEKYPACHNLYGVLLWALEY